jgi:hypothetical protein
MYTDTVTLSPNEDWNYCNSSKFSFTEKVERQYGFMVISRACRKYGRLQPSHHLFTLKETPSTSSRFYRSFTMDWFKPWYIELAESRSSLSDRFGGNGARRIYHSKFQPTSNNNPHINLPQNSSPNKIVYLCFPPYQPARL